MLVDPVLALPDALVTVDCHDQLVVQALLKASSKMVRADPEEPVVAPVVVEGVPVVEAEPVVVVAADPVVLPGVPVVAEAVVAEAVVAVAVVAAVVAEAVVAEAVVEVAPPVVTLTPPEPIITSMQVV